MKQISWLFMLAMVAFACQLQNAGEELGLESSGAPTPGNYVINSSSSDGYTWTITIDQSGAQAISHINFAGSFCDGASITAGNVTAVTVNGNDWMDPALLAGSTGNGDICGPTKLKLDKFDPFKDEAVVTVVITFDNKVSAGSFQIKSGQGCYGGANNSNYALTYDCNPPECYDYQNETAWAAGQRYVARGNWATYTAYQENVTVNVYAGQHMLAGTAHMSAVSGGNVTITITLNAGWSLQNVSSSVKIQGYSAAPSGNPSPGRFASKGTSLTVTVPAANFYGIHLDARKQIVVPCP